MTTRVPIRYGGTGANTAAAARTALGVPPLEAYDTANSAYAQANAAYAQANLAYDAANNAQVTVYANNSSNVTTQNVNFVNTATVTVTVTADGANANIEFTAAPQTVVNDTYTAAGNTAAAATANIANGLYAISTSAYGQANLAYSQANSAYAEANLKLNLTGGTINGNLVVTGTANASALNVTNVINANRISLSNTGTAVDASQGNILTNQVTGTQFNFLSGLYTATVTGGGSVATNYTLRLPPNVGLSGQVFTTDGTGNTSWTDGGVGVAYGQANAAYNQANAAYAQANLAYSAANNSNLLSGGLITGTLNVTQDIIVGGNLYLSGNTTFINVSTYQVNDPLIFLAANNILTDFVDIGFIGGKNTSGTFSHTGLARDATDAKYKLFDNLPDDAHQNNVINFANATIATLVANIESDSILLSGNAVATNVQVNAAFFQANTAYAQANAAYGQANLAYGQANTAYGQANSAYAQANLAYDAANNAQVTIYANNASNVTTQNINFVNTSSIAVTVTADGSNANIAFSSVGGGIVNTVIKTVTYSATNAASNLTYNLPISPAGVPYIFVIKNGITLTPNTDYSLAGNTLTVIESGAANDTIEVRYFDSVNVFTPPDTTILVDSNVVSSQTNTFYISQNAASINSLTVSKNGLVLTPGLHFSVTNNIVTLNTAAEINDTMLFVHMYTFGNVYNDVILKTGGTMTGNLNVAASLITQNIVPNLNVTYDLGTSTKRFKDLWLSNSTIYIGNTTISANGDKLVVPALELSSGANLSNAVLKTGSAMTGQLNIVSGGLVVNSNSIFNVPALYVDWANSEVGLGTSNPTANLTVIGSTFITNSGISNPGSESVLTISSTNGDYPHIQLHENSAEFSPRSYSANNSGFVNFYGVSFGEPNFGNALDFVSGCTAERDGSIIRFLTAGSGTASVTERVRIEQNGRVGIGVTNPTSPLEVGQDEDTYLGITIRSVIDEFGSLRVISNNRTTTYAVFSGSQNGTEVGSAANVPLSLKTNDSTRVFIGQTGNVGIGTTDPTANLHVTGTIKDTPVVSINGNQTYADNAAGRVIFSNTTSALTVTIAPAATAGFSYTVIRGNTGNVTIANSGVTRLNSAAITSMNVTQFGAATVVYTATNQVIVFGDFV